MQVTAGMSGLQVSCLEQHTCTSDSAEHLQLLLLVTAPAPCDCIIQLPFMLLSVSIVTAGVRHADLAVVVKGGSCGSGSCSLYKGAVAGVPSPRRESSLSCVFFL